MSHLPHPRMRLPLPSPSGCGRAPWMNTPASSTSSARASCCGARSRRTASPRSSFTVRRGRERPLSPQIIARATRSRFERLSGVESNVADFAARDCHGGESAAHSGAKTILFVDEIHRFNKAQQDVLLPDVERGTVRFIGATTHNPFFYVNSPLVSRSQVFQLEPLTPRGSRRAAAAQRSPIPSAAWQTAASRLRTRRSSTSRPSADGDARTCLNALEIAVVTTPPDARRHDPHRPRDRRGEHSEKGGRL